MRYSKEDVRNIYTRFITALCPNPLERGDYFLDYHAMYGGYVITKIIDRSPLFPAGSESFPFGLARRSASEMYMSLLLATNVLEVIDNHVLDWVAIEDEGKE